MCGIAGYTGSSIPDLMPKMLDSIRHRGPDDSGAVSFGSATLGMTRLSIIDLAGGRQPISNEDDTLWVVFNGEIYNYVELRQELASRGHRFKTASDTETLLHAYEEYGEQFLHKLNGMFAVAIWDEKRQKLFVARDRFGIKPLFYSLRREQLIFGSEIKTVLAHPAVGCAISDEALTHYLSLRYVPAPLTIYDDVRALEPGHLLVWCKGRLDVKPWYQLRIAPTYTDEDETSVIERIDALLRDSVRLRLRADVDVGAFLSGGIDSSTIVALASQLTNRPVKTFSLTFADSPDHKKDAYFAKKVAEQFRTDHREYVMSSAELAKECERVIEHLDQPFAGVISSFWLSRYMSQFVKVSLSGDGADDRFASYGHLRLVWSMNEYQRAIAEGREPDARDFGFFADNPEFVREMSRLPAWESRLTYAAFMERDKVELLSQKGRERLGRFSTSSFLKAIYERAAPGLDAINRMLYLDIHTLLPNEILYFNDMLSMASGLEVRTPFLDYRIVELASSIPGTLKIRGKELKYVLRRVAARYLPREMIDCPKEGFVLPKNTWLKTQALAKLVALLSPDRLAVHGLFDQRYVDNLLSSFMAGDDRLTFKVWTLIVFQLWYERSVGADAPR